MFTKRGVVVLVSRAVSKTGFGAAALSFAVF
jgi:hypothetical protein